jgi:hypothetical protein
MQCKNVLTIMLLLCGLATAQWEKCNLPNFNYANEAVINSIAVDGNNVFAASNIWLFCSRNNGTSWDSISLPGGKPVIAFGDISDTVYSVEALLANGPLVIAYGLFNYYLYRSLDSGASWSIDSQFYHSFDVLFAKGTICYGGCGYGPEEGGPFRSLDSGASWTGANAGIPLIYTCPGGDSPECGYYSPFIVAFASNDSFLFAGTMCYSLLGDTFPISGKRGIYRSADSGIMWTQADIGLTDSNIQCFAVNGTNLYAGTLNHGVFLTTNNGNSWAPVNSGLTNLNIRSLVAVGSHLFAGTKGKGVFHSPDSGKRWLPFNNGLADSTIAPLAADSLYLFAGSDSSGGHVWRFPLADIAVLKQNHSSLQPFGLKVMAAGRSSSSIGIEFSLAHSGRAHLGIYDLSGHLLATLLDKQLPAGEHTVAWDGRSVGSGCYVVRLEAGGTMETKAVPVILK